MPLGAQKEIELREDEQVVHAIRSRRHLSALELLTFLAIAVLIFAGMYAKIWLFFAAIFMPLTFLKPKRPTAYIVTTRRVLVFDRKGISEEMDLDQITAIKGNRDTLTLHSGQRKMQLLRLPNAWFFHSLIGNVMEKIGLERL